MKQFFRNVFSCLGFSRQLTISIVINTLNRAEALARTLAGLDRLESRDFEVIVVPGPCTDRTDDLLNAYASRIRIGRCPQPILGISRNIGLEMAAGDIVAFTDDDAVPRATWLEEIRRGYTDDSIGAVGGFVYDAVLDRMQWRVCTVARDGSTSTDTPPPYDRYQGPDANPYMYLAGCNMSFRRSCLIAAGGFNESFLSIYDDAEIAAHIHRAGHRVVSNGEAMVDHFYDANDIRDEKRVIRDPYNIIRDFTVFLMHTRRPGEAETAAVDAAAAQREYWRNAGAAHIANAVFTQAEYDAYVGRCDQALRDGLAAGATARKMRQFRPPAADAFRRFKN